MNFLLEVSLTGALLIVLITIIRALAMHKLPKNTFLILWGVVLIRLLIPFSIPLQTSVFNLQGLINTEQFSEVYFPTQRVAEPFLPMPIMSPATLPFQGDFIAANTTRVDIEETISPANNFSLFLYIAPLALVYFAGLILLGTFFIVVYFRHMKQFRTSLPIQNDFVNDWLDSHKIKRHISIRVLDTIATPLTYGILNPVILLPKNTDWGNEDELGYVLTHEFVHIRRFDALTKLVVAAVLCIHWFNPFVWVMYFLLNRDVEISCDEAVVNMFGFGKSSKQGYALTLIGMMERKSHIPVLYNNFSKHAIEERINAIMKMKKRTLAGTLASLVLVVTTTTVFATNGMDSEAPLTYQGTIQTIQETTQAPQGTTQTITFMETESADSPSHSPTVSSVISLTTNNQNNFEAVLFEPYRRYDNVGGHIYHFSHPSINSVSVQEAALTGANAVEKYFGVSIEGTTLLMHYIEGIDPNDPISVTRAFLGINNPELHIGLLYEWSNTLGMTSDEIFEYIERDGWGYSVNELADRLGVTRAAFVDVASVVSTISRPLREMSAQPNVWHGLVMLDQFDIPQFTFSVNAETGELTDRISHIPNIPQLIIEMEQPRLITSTTLFDFEGREPDVIVVFTEPVTDQHNYEIARHAIQLAEERNMFEDGVARARILGLTSSHRSWTPIPAFWVQVESTSGEVIMMIFTGLLDDEKVLETIEFGLPFGHDSRIDTTNAATRVEGEPFHGPFEWVNR